MRKFILIFAFLAIVSALINSQAHAAVYQDTARFTQGFQKIFGSVFQLPIELVTKSFSQAPPIGIINGALTGTYKTVSSLMSGLWDMAGAAAPYAKYALFFA